MYTLTYLFWLLLCKKRYNCLLKPFSPPRTCLLLGVLARVFIGSIMCHKLLCQEWPLYKYMQTCSKTSPQSVSILNIDQTHAHTET